jgi:hypothetical protein
MLCVTSEETLSTPIIASWISQEIPQMEVEPSSTDAEISF